LTRLVLTLAGLLSIGCPGRAGPSDLASGVYRVCAAQQGSCLGSLTLADGRFRYVPDPGAVAPAWIRDRFVFVASPSGQYRVLPRPIDPAKEGVRTLAEIAFSTDGSTPEATDRKRRFLLFFDPRSRETFFHSIVGEFQIWRVYR
jgi:hypothetical protein